MFRMRNARLSHPLRASTGVDHSILSMSSEFCASQFSQTTSIGGSYCDHEVPERLLEGREAGSGSKSSDMC